MKVSKLRRIAWHVEDGRSYLRFSARSAPMFNWPVTRGPIPWLLWRSARWRDQHITQPAIRQRLRWDASKLTPGALPEPYVDNTRVTPDGWPGN